MINKSRTQFVVLFGVIIVILVIVSFEKGVFDFRNEYCGNYYFKGTKSFTVNSLTSVEKIDFYGSVYYSMDIGRDEIIINYLESVNRKAQIDKEGGLTGSSSNSRLSGNFYSNDSLSFHYSFSSSPCALGFHDVTGVRTD